jgi:hypothetical protein
MAGQGNEHVEVREGGDPLYTNAGGRARDPRRDPIAADAAASNELGSSIRGGVPWHIEAAAFLHLLFDNCFTLPCRFAGASPCQAIQATRRVT